MKYTISVIFLLWICAIVKGQNINTDWYSETTSNGVIIQNSYPKGGPYPGPTKEFYNYSYLVFFTRVINETGAPFELSINFSGESFAIPNSSNTFMKLFLPSDTMTLDKRALFSYGITELESLEKPTSFKRKVMPKEDCMFYAVGIFYQTKADAWRQERGGNRAELVLKGQELFYRIPPQVDYLPCGRIIFDK
jgi:hypothetical protein